jgi:hypothetical protein
LDEGIVGNVKAAEKTDALSEVAEKVMKINAAISNDVKGMIQTTGQLAEASGVSITGLQADIDKLLDPAHRIDLSAIINAKDMNQDNPEILI